MSETTTTTDPLGPSMLQKQIDDTSLWLLFALAGGAGASVLALGMLLRSNEQLTRRAVIGTLLHSLAWGAAVFLMTYKYGDLQLHFVLGLSVLSGMGAASMVDLVLLMVKQRLGISITVNPPRGNTRPGGLNSQLTDHSKP
jgi:hypothetical protein